ncbi:hypothetical protein NHX12_008821 [Muraenolepis orangiensis]|uniref:TFIIS N-terminal domain-containing protein n=1 Tax=Muraenolepis orangiensis TaxID=630683 RepID=A0A9Q0DM33_9TELE|nr:hypothetical protein NHX12_008821 [Muraenolepis orangiensis]
MRISGGSATILMAVINTPRVDAAPMMEVDDGSECEDGPRPKETSGPASGSDDEGPAGGHSDSEGEAPGRNRGNSDSEGEAPGRNRGNDSDSEAEAPGRNRGNDSDSEAEAPERKRANDSDSEVEAPGRNRGNNSDSEAEAPGRNRGNNSDSEAEAPGRIRGNNSDSEAEAPGRKRGNNSDSEAEAPGHKRGNNSDSEAEAPGRKRGNNSDSEAEAPGRKRGNNSDSEAEAPGRKRGNNSDSEVEAPGHNRGNNSDSEGEGPRPADSDEEDSALKSRASKEEDRRTPPLAKHSPSPAHNADSQSDSDMPARKKSAALNSDNEEEGKSEKQEGEAGPVKRKKAVLSDSEEDDTPKPVKRSRAMSDEDNSDEDGPDRSMAAKLRELGSDSEEEEGPAQNKDQKTLFGSDSESGGDQEEKMIADIFGESGDEEEEEFTGFNQEELEGQQKAEKPPAEEDSDSDEGVDRSGKDTSMMSDFDIMLARKKAQGGKRRRNRDGGTFISDADDVVSAMIIKMNEAAEEDRTLNSQKKPALRKLTLLPAVVTHLKKQDLKETFIDSGVMTAIKEWIGPLPDKSLPALRIRGELLKILHELPSVSQETLKHSGIGRAVMFLYKHPKESRPNKDLALKLINEWSRPIFGLTSNYKGMTREERQQRDLDQQMPQKRRLSQTQKEVKAPEPDVFSPSIRALRPGEPGFCARARVPMPSNKDYVVRPKWNIETESNRSGFKKGISRLEKHKRRIADQRKRGRLQGAVKISVQGTHMPL